MNSSRFGEIPLWVTLAGVLLLTILGGPLSTAQDAVLDDEALLARLREGGLVIVFRHGHSDRTQTDRLDLAGLHAINVAGVLGLTIGCAETLHQRVALGLRLGLLSSTVGA